MSIEVANESGVAVDETALADLSRHVLDGMRVNPLADLSVLLVDVPAMTKLHVQWMDESGPTDVLSFPMDELRPGPEGGTSASGDALGPRPAVQGPDGPGEAGPQGPVVPHDRHDRPPIRAHIAHSRRRLPG